MFQGKEIHYPELDRIFEGLHQLMIRRYLPLRHILPRAIYDDIRSLGHTLKTVRAVIIGLTGDFK